MTELLFQDLKKESSGYIPKYLSINSPRQEQKTKNKSEKTEDN